MKPLALVVTGLLGSSMAASAPIEHKTLNELLIEASTPEEVKIEEPVNPSPLPQVADRESVWGCESCNENEKKTLAFLQERGITDRAAIATVMGNIRQESNFHTNICEGGARVNYDQCHSGGFGLIQWTSINRYVGLGKFAAKYGLDPNSIDGQLRYMVNEPQWTRFEKALKAEGQSIKYYMGEAYYWLGWGIHGARTQYAYNYYNKLAIA